MDKTVDGVFHLAVLASILLFLGVCIAIFSRYVFGYPLNWLPGIVTLLSDWAIFLMVGVYLYRNDDIVIPYFYENVIPEGLKLPVDVFVALAVAGFTTIMVWACWKSMQMGDYLTSITTIPIHYYWFTIPFFIGMVMGMVGVFKRIFRKEYVLTTD